MAPVIVAALVTTLFLSGWRGYGPIPGPIWFILKTFVVLFGFVWIRASWPRLRVDQIMAFAWKGLLPMAIINTLVMTFYFLLMTQVRNNVFPCSMQRFQAQFSLQESIQIFLHVSMRCKAFPGS